MELLKGIIKQVVSKLKATGRAPELLADVLQKHFRTEHSRQNEFILVSILKQLLSVLEFSIVIIDGLHEMSEHEASSLLKILRQLSAAPELSGKVKFAIFSREEIGPCVSVITALPDVKHLRLTMQLLEKDIFFFIDERIREKRAFVNVLTEDEDLMTELRSIIRQKGEKM
jgi:hypothetical protein